MSLNLINVRYISTKLTLLKNAVQLTKDRFPDLKRGSYSIVNSIDVEFFKNLLTENNIIIGEEAKSYNEDWLKSVSGKYLVIMFVNLSINVTYVF